MTGPPVGIEFTGSSVGAVRAAEQTAAGIATVRREAGVLSPSLRTAEQDLGRLSRGGLAGTGIFNGLGRSVAFASASFLGGYGLLAALRGAATELSTQVELNAQVHAAIRSTGGVAGVTARMIDGLAAAEMRKTGADQQQIKQAEIMLLRYTNVRDVAGQGNDVFKRATQASLDLATALGTNASDAATTLGKALQDPLKGVTSLSRAHIALTAQEIVHIKQLAQEGKVLEAQKAILDAVTRSYGGTAKAVSNVAPWTRLRSTLMELSANAIKPLLPDIDGLIGRVQKWSDGLAHNRGEQERLKTDVEEGAHAIGDIAKAVQTVAGVMGGWGNLVQGLIALKVATTLSGWTNAVSRFSGAIGSETAGGGALSRTGRLLGNLRSLARIGTLSIGVDLLFQSKGQGAKGLIGAILTGAAIGSTGGPAGALIGALVAGTAALTIDVLVKQVPSSYKFSGTKEDANVQRQVAQATTIRPGETIKQLRAQEGRLGLIGDFPAVHAIEKLIAELQREGKYGRVSRQQASGFNRSFSGGAVNPARGDTYERIDQGVDVSGKAVGAIAAGVIVSVSGGMAGGTGAIVKQRFNAPVVVHGRTYYGAYYSEGKPVVQKGDHVEAGETVMTGPSFEIGFLLGKDLTFPPLRGGLGAKTKPDRSGYDLDALIRAQGGYGGGGGGGGGGASPPDTGPVTSGGVHSVTGSNLLPEGLRNQIAAAAAHVTNSRTPAVAERWLRVELGDLDSARKLLEEKLKGASGKQKAAIQQELRSVDAEIARVQHGIAVEAAKLAKTAAAVAALAAVKAIKKIEQESVGPEQTLKLAEAAGASASIILSDQEGLLASYQAEAAKLKAKMKRSSGEARSRYAAALAQIDQAVQNTEDGIVATLQSIYQAAQEKVATAAGRVEQDVISQFEKQTQDYITNVIAPQYFQGVDPVTGLPRQTPAEAELAAMQAQDQQQSLQSALQQAQQQLAKDIAAQGPAPGGGAVVSVDGTVVSGGTGSDAVSQDEQAVQAAQRAIDENNLATQATAERAAADAAYAAAVQTYTDSRSVDEEKLQTALDNWAAGLADGTTNLTDLNAIAAAYGVTLTDLADPNTGIGYDFSVLSSAAQDAAAALQNLTVAAGGTVTTTTGDVVLAGSATTVGGQLLFAQGGKVPGPRHVNRDSVPALLMPGETMIDRSLTDALEQVFLGGGGGFPRMVAGDVYMDSQKVGRTVARPVSDQQRRQISYTLQRG